MNVYHQQAKVQVQVQALTPLLEKIKLSPAHRNKSSLKTVKERAGQEIDIREILPYAPLLCDSFDAKAQNIGIQSTVFLNTLLTAVASVCPIGTYLELWRDFKARPIFWYVLLGESGQGKGAAQSVVLDPLWRLEEKSLELDQQGKQKYEQDLAAWKSLPRGKNGLPKPERPGVRRVYACKRMDLKGLGAIQFDQLEHGFLVHIDRLGRRLQAFNKGLGWAVTDQEDFLSLKNGEFINSDFTGKYGSYSSFKSSVSITGTTQPNVWRQVIDASDYGTGLASRFHIEVAQPLNLERRTKCFDDKIPSVGDYLEDLYAAIASSKPKAFSLSKAASKPWMSFCQHMENRIAVEKNNGLRSCYYRMKGDVGTIALLLHILDYHFRSQEPTDEIPGQAMERAVRLAQYFIEQVHIIRGLSTIDLAQIKAQAEAVLRYISGGRTKTPRTATPLDLRRGCAVLKKGVSTPQIEALCIALAEHGLAHWDGSVLSPVEAD